jgi:putative polymerase
MAYITSTDSSSLNDSRRGHLAFALVVAAVSFNFILCLVNTNVSPVSNLSVIGCEFTIIALAFLVGYSGSSLTSVYFLIILVLYLSSLALARGVNSFGGVDIKIVRDFLIPVAFFWLGRTISIKDADRIIRWLVGVVLVVGFFEYFFLDLFLKYLNVLNYYIARGTVPDIESARLAAGGLMVSGMRPEGQGRELLPWLLGTHRVSSIFLEPSSLGNFGIIITLWAALRSKIDGKVWGKLILAGICCIVLSDTRFAALFLPIGILMMFLPMLVGTVTVALMPFFAVVFLLVVINPSDTLSNDSQGRLAYAAFVFTRFDIFNWLGFKESLEQTFDAGYGYLFADVGVFGVIALWLCFMTLRAESDYFYGFRNAAGAYFSALFLISQSQMTIKTAALLWLLLGVVSVFQGSERKAQFDTRRVFADLR